jgi:hypothetical protein
MLFFSPLLFTHILPPMQFKSAIDKCHTVGTCENVNVFLLISYLSSFLNSINTKEFNRIIKVNLHKQFMIIYDHLSHKCVLLVSCTTNKKYFFLCSKYVKILRKFIIIDFFPIFWCFQHNKRRS